MIDLIGWFDSQGPGEDPSSSGGFQAGERRREVSMDRQLRHI
jgi:hypothetical protein